MSYVLAVELHSPNDISSTVYQKKFNLNFVISSEGELNQAHGANRKALVAKSPTLSSLISSSSFSITPFIIQHSIISNALNRPIIVSTSRLGNSGATGRNYSS
jgi:hypothetical protein